MEAGQELTLKDGPLNPSRMDQKGRESYGIEKQLPQTLNESLAALAELDWRLLGLGEAASRYSTLKSRETFVLGMLSDDARRAMLVRLF